MCDVLVPGGVVFHHATDVDLSGYPGFAFKRYYSSHSSGNDGDGERLDA